MKYVMKTTLLATGLFMAMFGSGLAADKLIIGTEGAYPPFNSVTADGSVVGFDIDIANELCKHMNVECRSEERRVGKEC